MANVKDKLFHSFRLWTDKKIRWAKIGEYIN